MLNDQYHWEDTGAGYATTIWDGDARFCRLVFSDEETGEVLHDWPLFSSDIYQLQSGDRPDIIVWEDPESGEA
eukprot:9678699-Heterocapsa_arctica.AAC.1